MDTPLGKMIELHKTWSTDLPSCVDSDGDEEFQDETADGVAKYNFPPPQFDYASSYAPHSSESSMPPEEVAARLLRWPAISDLGGRCAVDGKTKISKALDALHYDSAGTDSDDLFPFSDIR